MTEDIKFVVANDGLLDFFLNKFTAILCINLLIKQKDQLRILSRCMETEYIAGNFFKKFAISFFFFFLILYRQFV